MTTLHEAIVQFLSSKKVDSGLAKNSTDSYESDLRQFELYISSSLSADLSSGTVGEHSAHGTPTLPEPASIPLTSITETILEKYLHEKKAEGLKPASLSRKTSALRQLFKFCAIELELEMNPAENLTSNRKARQLPKALSEEKIAALLKATEEGLPYAKQKFPEALRARDRAMLTLLYATGLRVSELVNLKPEHIDFDLNFLRVMGKGSKERLVPFVSEARERLVEYRDHHLEKLIPPTPRVRRSSPPSLFFFLTSAGEPLTRQGFWKCLKHIGEKAGLAEDLSPHWIRHSFATHLLEHGLGLRTLQTLLGHADVSTTQIYTEMSPAHLKEVHEKFHPRGEMSSSEISSPEMTHRQAAPMKPAPKRSPRK